jgi:hypothetical protein
MYILKPEAQGGPTSALLDRDFDMLARALSRWRLSRSPLAFISASNSPAL